MSFPRYPAYKDSGVEWLGQIPAHWGLERFRHRFRESSETIQEVVVGPMLSVSGYRGIEIKVYDDDNRRRSDEDLIGYRIARPGQLVVNTMWLNFAGLGVSPFEGHVSPAYRCFWIDGSLERGFVHHLMRSSRYVSGYTSMVQGIRPNSLQLSRDDLMSLPVLVPPLPEQTAIAAFLDRETGKIDALIAEQQRLIELLQEKRQAVISHAVTKGLDPSVPMKDSGVEWLGEIPAHWTLSRVKRLSTLQRGYDLKRDDCEEGSVPVVTSSGITGTHSVSMASGPGVVTGRYGSTGRLFYIEEAFWPHNTTLFVCNFHGNNERFVWYSLHTVDFESHSEKAAVPGVDRNDIHILPVAIPSLRDQVAIAAYLDRHTSLIDSFAFQCQQAITLLQERRSALISAAVTGQIDVRAEAA